MPPTNKIWTLRELDGGAIAASNYDSATFDPNEYNNNDGSSSSASPTFIKCCHIPSLPNADTAKALLERVVREFEPIAKRRGYNVVSVSELCCCNDGLDYEPSSRRKRRKMANNIWGYNQTTGNGYTKKQHTIHLRLRHATNHARFHLYEDVAGTMAHELAHCEHGPHNEKFYKLMDDILEEHAMLMASNLTRGGGQHSMPAFAGNGHTLGNGNGNTGTAGTSRLVNQQQQQQQHAGYTLGGDNAFTQWMTPKEAAAVAAEARRRQLQLRLRGDRCCRPCVIHIDEDESNDDDDESNDDKQREEGDENHEQNNNNDDDDRAPPTKKKKHMIDVENLKPAALPASAKTKNKKLPTATAAAAAAVECIDLTEEGDNTTATTSAAAHRKASVARFALLPPRGTRFAAAAGAAASFLQDSSWSCSRCTFFNESTTTRACAMCEAKPPSSCFRS